MCFYKHMGNGTLIEKRSIDYVPLAERHGKVWHLWPVWFSGDAHLATLAVGVLGITLGGNLLWTAVAVLAGCLLGTFFMAFHSTQGPQLGLPQMIQSRPQFGYSGALLVWAVAMVAYIGYNAFNQVLAAQALHQLTTSISPTSPAAIIVFALIAVGLAAVGYDKIHLAQRAFAYLMIAILTVFSLGALCFLKFPAAQWDPAAFRGVPFLAELFAAASYQLSWSIYVSDYSRYLPRDVGVRASFWWTYLGAFVGGAWMMLVGTVAAAAAPTLDVAAAMEHAADLVLPGLGKVLLVGALLGLITISALNFYGASLTLLSVADTVRPLRCTVAKRLASLAVAFVASNAIAFNPSGMYGQWNWRGLIAYVVGFAVMIPFFSSGMYTGPIARALGGADVAMLVGLPVAAGIYLLACRSIDLRQDRQRAAAADTGLDPDDGATAQTA